MSNCKHCKHLIIGIELPSELQICGKTYKSVNVEKDECGEYFCDEDSIKRWNHIKEMEKEIINDPNSDYSRAKYDVN